jgi:hypothetical protein
LIRFFICCTRVTGGAAKGASIKPRVMLDDDSITSGGGACADANAQVRIKTGMIFNERIIC